MDCFGLPANALHHILDGFAHASDEEFKQLYTTLSIMNCSVLMQNNVNQNQSVRQKCFAALKDLEVTYIDLSTGHKWNGVGHNNSAFVTKVKHDDDPTLEQSYAMAACHAIPFEEWVKDKDCHGCGKKGHIKPHCPDRKEKDKSKGWYNNDN